MSPAPCRNPHRLAIPSRAAAAAQEELRWQQMQSRQTFMAAMGGVDPGEEGYDEYDEARRRPALPPARPPAPVCALLLTRMCALSVQARDDSMDRQ